MPDQAAPVLRTYTLSTCANPDHYRLSIRRADPGFVSRFMHEHGKPGARIDAMAPRGKFVLDQSSERPVALLSGGVGLTPMIAITEHIVAEGQRTGKFRGSTSFTAPRTAGSTRSPHTCARWPPSTRRCGSTSSTAGPPRPTRSA